MNKFKETENLLKTLFPLNRGLVSKQNLETLKIIKKKIPLKILSINSGKKVFDWTVPNEWEIKDGFISDLDGNRIIDFKMNNLHVATNSSKVDKVLSFKQLSKKLDYSKNLKGSIPYRTMYYKKDWGFCITKNQYANLSKYKKLKVVINSKFKKGKLNIGELLIPGKSKKEILISTYICHPSLANDNLSGVVVTLLLAKFLNSLKKLNWSYRIVFLPETIGAISYLHLKKEIIKKKVILGFVITCVGGPDGFSYKETWDKSHFLNDLIKNFFKKKKIKVKKYNFDVNGSDERQYSSLGFRINTASIFKSKYYNFSEYHTSADNLNFVKSKNILKSLNIYKQIINTVEKIDLYESTIKYCEPMLKKHNLFSEKGGSFLPKKKYSITEIIFSLIFLLDGKTTINQICEKLIIKKNIIVNLIKMLLKKKLINAI
jgi:aminopeptidase-like protein